MPRRVGCWITLGFCLSLPWLSVVRAGNPLADVNLVVGQKQLDSREWEPAEEQDGFALESSWGGTNWPVLIAADLTYHGGDESVEGIKFEGETIELALGVRRSFRIGRFRPYAGGGVALINAEVTASGFGDSESDDDSATGFWVGGGLLWRIGSHLNLGLAARFSDAEVTLAGIDGDAGGVQYGIAIGWAWH